MKRTLALLTAFVLLVSSSTFSSCKTCDKNKGKDTSKDNSVTDRDKNKPVDVDTTTSDMASNSAGSGGTPGENTIDIGGKGAGSGLGSDVELTKEQKEQKEKEQEDKELEEAVKGKLDEVRKVGADGMKTWDVGLAAESLVEEAGNNRIKVSDVVKRYMAQIWEAVANAAWWNAQAARCYANALAWWAKVEDLEKAQAMQMALAESMTAVNNAAVVELGQDDCMPLPGMRNQHTLDENAKIFGNDWTWESVKTKIEADVRRSGDTVTCLKLKKGI